MQIRVRRALPGDAPALEMIERQSFSHPHWDAAGILHYDCIVAEVEGQILGFLVSRPLAASEREILNLAVSPDSRRLGVASALLKSELSKGSTHFLEVRESNLAAQSLYRKFGFQEVGRRPHYYDLPPETGIVMRVK